ncbi:DHHC palmitoyltransferase-domain-containing protein [Lactarius vividus]|nr:DHHC palmitoyltransferase-domain-containing protein [Lactarius vividus]
MSTENSLPLYAFEPGSLPAIRKPVDDYDSDDERPGNPRRWYHYVPLCIAVLLLLAPHPSILHVLLNYHYLTLHATRYFLAHLIVIYTLSFLAFSSLIVCVARDPGPVPEAKPEGQQDAGGELSLEDALLSTPPEDYTQPGKWCRICWQPKPERAHHCSQCGRCVLKMDHHCPWMGAKCIGFRTYPSFLHFLASVTLLAIYVAVICIRGLNFAFRHPLAIDETTPVHMLLLSFAGCAFTLIMGSFFGYHVYLVLTNQTTLEHISPFYILRYLPPLPPGRLSSPPLEHQLASGQRRAVRAAHARLNLYDVGWRRNVEQVFGMGAKRRWQVWAGRLLWGGGCYGAGTQFPHNPRAEDVLAELAVELIRLENSTD